MTPNPKKDELKELRDRFAKPIADTLIDSAKEQYGRDLRKSTQNQLERKIQETTETVVNREYGDYVIRDNQLIKECNDRIYEAQNSGASMAEITKIDEEYSAKRMQGYRDMVDNIKEKLHSDETVKKAAETIVETVETEKLKAEKDSIEGNVRDALWTATPTTRRATSFIQWTSITMSRCFLPRCSSAIQSWPISRWTKRTPSPSPWPERKTFCSTVTCRIQKGDKFETNAR